MKSYIKYVAVLLTVVIIASGAVIYVNSTNPNTTQNGSITIVDDQGYTTTFSEVPQRIVSLAPSVTPILYEIGVGDKVVGLTQYDDSPYNFTAWFDAGNMTCVGGFSTPNLETIATLEPDVIFTTDVNEETIPNMRELGYKVIVLSASSVEDIYNDIGLVGNATGAAAKATEVITDLRSQISEIQATIEAAHITEKPTVYYEVYCSDSGIMTAGSTTWINDVIGLAGGVNIFNDQAQEFPYTSSEVVVQRNPGVIILPTNMGTGAPSYGSVADVKARSGWSSIDAIKNDRLYVIDQDIMSEPGIRVADQVQAVAACLYPQLF
ncbi:MAG: helical backbone metal receptor [Candidatus Bathyarchaeota archaeon]|nr:helical backbone metal receptor [Candidatus Bathyarchaeota archaeon]